MTISGFNALLPAWNQVLHLPAYCRPWKPFPCVWCSRRIHQTRVHASLKSVLPFRGFSVHMRGDGRHHQAPQGGVSPKRGMQKAAWAKVTRGRGARGALLPGLLQHSVQGPEPAKNAWGRSWDTLVSVQGSSLSEHWQPWENGVEENG